MCVSPTSETPFFLRVGEWGEIPFISPPPFDFQRVSRLRLRGLCPALRGKKARDRLDPLRGEKRGETHGADSVVFSPLLFAVCPGTDEQGVLGFCSIFQETREDVCVFCVSSWGARSQCTRVQKAMPPRESPGQQHTTLCVQSIAVCAWLPRALALDPY